MTAEIEFPVGRIASMLLAGNAFDDVLRDRSR